MHCVFWVIEPYPRILFINNDLFALPIFYQYKVVVLFDYLKTEKG